MTTTKILIVEDESIVAIDIQDSLLNLGYDVPHIVDTGIEAIQMAKEFNPDLVLMDIHLKGEMDGIEASEHIYRELNIPIIFLTANTDEATYARAKLTGPFGYLLKPFRQEELHTTIGIALYKHQVDVERQEQEQRLTTILQSIGEAVVVSDPKGQVTFINPVAEELTHWPALDALGKKVSIVAPVLNDATLIPIPHPAESALSNLSSVVWPENILLETKGKSRIPIALTAAPLKDSKGKAMGVVTAFRDMTDHQQARELLIRNAFYDALTTLPNRALLFDRLHQSLERVKQYPNDSFALLFIDVDRFKMVNDSFGHPCGDQLLFAIGKRLRQNLFATDTVARFGGDEFAILLEHVHDVEMACSVADRINTVLQQPFQIEGQNVYTSASIGVVLGNANYQNADDLLRDADIAMYRAKEAGNGCFAVFEPGMYDQVKGLLQLENDIREAIANREFEVHYQPILSLSTQQIMGFEALVRWRHPEQGLISPGHFIPVAEETGLIVPIDWWVLDEACIQMRFWQQQFPSNPPLSISVNISSKHFAQPSLVDQVRQTLEKTGLPPKSLKLEITETAFIENPEFANVILAKLKQLGVELCIDDFGTGYSSLSYLHRFPLDVLKIDRSFINSIQENEEKLKIVKVIISLAKTLGMPIVAEGIEVEQQAEILQALECEYAQGFLFHKPVEAKKAEVLLQEMKSHNVQRIST